MHKKTLALLAGGFLISTLGSQSQAAVRPSLRHDATNTKSKAYASDGYFIGGDKSVTSVKLTDIRRGPQKEGYERIVFDLKAQGGGGQSSVPHFLVQNSPDEGRFILSIWSDVAYDFDKDKVAKAIAKSRNIKRMNVVPRVEEGLAIVEFTMNSMKDGKKPKLDVFHLSNPPRIIVDIL